MSQTSPPLSQHVRHPVELTLNGRRRTGHALPRMLLSDFLREELGATGTHVGCEHGVCGACTVRIDGVACRACLTLAVQVDGRQVDTVEGLALRDVPAIAVQYHPEASPGPHDALPFFDHFTALMTTWREEHAGAKAK